MPSIFEKLLTSNVVNDVHSKRPHKRNLRNLQQMAIMYSTADHTAAPMGRGGDREKQ
jgi:hypothetical protein